jgi:hypothetical protein
MTGVMTMTTTPGEPRSVILARIADRQRQMVSLLAEADRQWWRPLRARRLRARSRVLHALNDLDFEKLNGA